MVMKLIPITRQIFDHPEICSTDLIREACKSTLRIYPANGPVDPWLGYLAEIDRKIIGACAFKSAPQIDADKKSLWVEIAYFTFPDYEGNGYATEMASRLLAIAQQNAVTYVTAQTETQPNASTNILEKLGFINTGSVMHPDDGEVWQWQCSLKCD
jgi:ribosomal-protein-alanine N-acetyltransferase